MKYADLFKYSKEMDVNFITKIAESKIKSTKNNFLKKGRKAILKEINFFDQDGDNFIKNLVTVRILYNVFKIPRIINPLHRR